jgi:hypothetical protein
MQTPLNLKKFKLFLDEYLPYVDEHVPTIINSGGCGYFAYYLSGVLEKMNVPHKIKLLFTDYDISYDKVARSLADKTPVNAGAGHVVVEVDGQYLIQRVFLKTPCKKYWIVIGSF